MIILFFLFFFLGSKILINVCEVTGHCNRTYLCCGEEDVIRYVAHSTGYNTQSNSREDVSVVSLPGVKGTSISQRHFVEWTPTSEDAPALLIEREMMMKKNIF